MPATLSVAFLLLLSSSFSRACIPTETPDYIYDQEWLEQERERLATTSVLLTTVREATAATATTSPSSAAPTTTTTTSTSTSTSTSTTTTTGIPMICPGTWTLRSDTGVCYYVGAAPVNWNIAEMMCATLGGPDAHLVSIADQAENDFVFNNVIAPGATANFWIGLKEPMNQQTLMGMATWSDMTPYNYPGGYTNWNIGPPPIFSEDRCGMMVGHQGGASDSKWFANACMTSTYPYICEVRAT